MPSDGTPCLLDSSVLINFLKIGRTDLLSTHPHSRFLVTPDVQSEITEQYALQVTRFQSALASECFKFTRLEAPQEVLAFVELTKLRLGPGEAAALAAGALRGHSVAIDDAAAQKKVKRIHPKITIVTTADLIHDHVVAALLTVQAADELKAELEAQHRFRMPFQSFADRTHRTGHRPIGVMANH